MNGLNPQTLQQWSAVVVGVPGGAVAEEARMMAATCAAMLAPPAAASAASAAREVEAGLRGSGESTGVGRGCDLAAAAAAAAAAANRGVCRRPMAVETGEGVLAERAAGDRVAARRKEWPFVAGFLEVVTCRRPAWRSRFCGRCRRMLSPRSRAETS